MGTHTLTHDAPSLSMFWLNDKNAFRELKKILFSRSRCTHGRMYVHGHHTLEYNSIVICGMLSFQSGQFSEDMIPTVGFNMRKVTKGNVTIKVWWTRFCFVSSILLASHADVFRRARLSSLPTNACSTENNIPFPSLANHIVLSKFWKVDLDRRVTR